MKRCIFALLLISLSLNLYFYVVSPNRRPNIDDSWVRPHPTVQLNSDANPGHSLFEWSVLQSTNYFVYRDNLRRIGCPEDLVIRVITGEIDQEYSKRIDHLIKNAQSGVWRNLALRGSPPDYGTEVEFKKILLERNNLRRVLFGTRISELEKQAAEWNNLQAFSQDFIYQFLLAGFDPGKKAKLYSVVKNRLFQFCNLEDIVDGLVPITPEELSEFRLRNTRFGRFVGLNSVLFPLSENEARRLAEIQLLYGEGKVSGSWYDPNLKNKDNNQIRMETDFRAILGEERYKLYRCEADFRFKRLQPFMLVHGVSLDRQIQIYQLTREVEAIKREIESTKIQSDEKRRLLSDLYSESILKLGKLLEPAESKTLFSRQKSAISVLQP